MKVWMIALPAALLLLCLAGIAVAEDAPPAGGAGDTIYKKKTVYDFEDDTITGDLTKPDGEYIDSRRKVKHQNLIKIRENWRDKVMQASGDL